MTDAERDVTQAPAYGRHAKAEPTAVEPEAPGVRLDVQAVADLSYPMAHCRIPVINGIRIDNDGDELRGAVLQLDVVSASGSHGGPREIHLDLAPHAPTVIRDVDLLLDPASMLAVDDPRPGTVRAVVRDAAGTVRAQVSADVTVLAGNQWKASPLQLALEMLAAHVQPNSAVITALMPKVSDRLQALTGSSALNGYQSDDPSRVDSIARAVYEEMAAADIRYAEPPASWGLNGQKIRTPAEVLDGRLGTCLDTTLTMAAVLEQAGINTTIWVLNGHAFLGYWRVDAALATVSTTEAVDVVNLVEQDQIRLVETTMLTGGEQASDFASATAEPRARHLGGDLSDILGVTDLRRARQAGIYALPSHAVDHVGNVTITEYTPPSAPVIAPYERPEVVSHSVVDQVPDRVRKWKNALLDLSLRNRLINYTERAGYKLAIPGAALPRLEDDINAHARITLLASDEVSHIEAARGMRYGRDLPEELRTVLLAEKHSAYIDITEASYKTTLRRLAYKAKTIIEESGSNNLYLAFGMLSWRYEDRDLLSPVVLVPVKLTSTNRGDRYVLEIDESGASTPNYCLIEKLRTAFGLEIPELMNPAEDASGIDLAGTFDAVRRAITRADLHFRVEETVHLSILQFAKFPLWKDLDESWRELANNSLVRHLIETPLAAYTDPVAAVEGIDLNELRAQLPVAADCSQLQAVADATAGRTFVLEGPPGTGKSQTITNLLAHAMASGRRVLFVAEKKAALDVVKKRLDAVGLGELSLNLHDKSARPAAVREQIKTALELRVNPDAERLRTSQQVAASARSALSRYADRLHAKNAAGLSAYTARSKELASDQEVPALEVPRDLVATADPAMLARLGDVLRGLPMLADLARPEPHHPWGFVDHVPADVGAVHRVATEFDAALAAVLDAGQPAGIGFEQLGRLAGPGELTRWAQLARAPRYPLAGIDQLNNPAWASELAALSDQLAALSADRPAWLDTAGPEAMDLDIPAIHAAAVAADESGFFGRKKRRAAVREQLTGVLVVAPDSVDLKGLSTGTAAMAQTYQVVADLRNRVSRIPVTVVDRAWNPLIGDTAVQLKAGIDQLVWLIGQLTQPGAHTADLRAFYERTPSGAMADQLQRLGNAWAELERSAGLAPDRRDDWGAGNSFFESWWQTRPRRRLETPAALQQWVDLVAHVEPLRAAGLLQARTQLLAGAVAAEDAALAFDRGIAETSVAERLDANALRDFDVAAHDKTIQRFTDATRAIREELPRAIPAKVLSGRRFDAFAESGHIGGLRRQLERKRGGMSIRALLENYGDLITEVLPCTLMSPDSVARFFPAKHGLFDIVVFDEASQIRVADAVGAMGRCRSVVVVGDSKQMPPTSFAEVSIGDDDEDYAPEAVLDEESILTECVQSQVPRQWLSWHYRSQDEALIAFSNQHYYDGRLASFPAPVPGNAVGNGYGVSFVRVNGVFERSGKGKTLRTNRAEAERIVADIRRRFAESPGAAPSLGVITFNAQQRDLIENLLRDVGDDRLLAALEAPDGLFVKNLENVQGDERDTILFSVAFSANDKGVVPLNFGPLSKPGGERRLNVAVTRARREVVLYASFDPAELRAEETMQLGTKHLKAYLEMAARGVDALDGTGRRQPVFDYHRDHIAMALRNAGLPVSVDVGLSDFRVDLVISDPHAPEQPLVAVLLDGPGWYSRGTVADRDGLPVDVLSGLLKWPSVQRVWLPEWLQNPGATVIRLKQAVEQARETVKAAREPKPQAEPVAVTESAAPVGPPATPVQPEAPSAPAAEQTEVAPLRVNPVDPKPIAAERSRHPLLVSYQEWRPRIVGGINVLDELSMGYAKQQVRRVIDEVIAAEGPVQPDRLAKLVAGAFGLNRVAESRRKSIQRLVPADYHRRDDPEGYYWPVGTDPATWRSVRCPAVGESRVLDEVGFIEIGNAMAVVAQQSGGIEPGDLKREALSLFGGRRMTAGIEARLDAALASALDRGRVSAVGGLIKCTGS